MFLIKINYQIVSESQSTGFESHLPPHRKPFLQNILHLGFLHFKPNFFYLTRIIQPGYFNP